MHVQSLINSQTLPIAEPKPDAVTDDEGFGFDDFLDIINPLQHLPVVGMVYRSLSGDEIEAPARIAGGALFGGLYGFLGSLASVAFEEITGESVERTILSLFDEPAVQTPPEGLARAYQNMQILNSDEIERSANGYTVSTPVVADLRI